MSKRIAAHLSKTKWHYNKAKVCGMVCCYRQRVGITPKNSNIKARSSHPTLASLQNSKRTGPDGIDLRVVFWLGDGSDELLSNLLTSLLVTVVMPTYWRYTTISPHQHCLLPRQN